MGQKLNVSFKQGMESLCDPLPMSATLDFSTMISSPLPGMNCVQMGNTPPLLDAQLLPKKRFVPITLAEPRALAWLVHMVGMWH